MQNINRDPRGKKSLFDKIIMEYFKSDPNIPISSLNLTNEEKEALMRYEFIDGLRRQHAPNLLTKHIQNLYNRKFPKMSQRQFYYDLRNSEKIFGSIVEIDKNYERSLSLEFYRMVQSLAIAQRDLKSALKAREQADKLMKLGEKDDRDEEEGASALVWHLTIEGNEKTSKLLQMHEIVTLPEGIKMEILKNCDTFDVTPENIDTIFEKEANDE